MNPAVLSLTSLEMEKKKLTVKKRTKTARESEKCPQIFTLKRGRVKQTICQNKMFLYKFPLFGSKSRVKH